jgi:hypothetical protein
MAASRSPRHTSSARRMTCSSAEGNSTTRRSITLVMLLYFGTLTIAILIISSAASASRSITSFGNALLQERKSARLRGLSGEGQQDKKLGREASGERY